MNIHKIVLGLSLFSSTGIQIFFWFSNQIVEMCVFTLGVYIALLSEIASRNLDKQKESKESQITYKSLIEDIDYKVKR